MKTRGRMRRTPAVVVAVAVVAAVVVVRWTRTKKGAMICTKQRLFKRSGRVRAAYSRRMRRI